MRRAGDEDADLWARAEAELAATSTEPAHLRAARERHDTRLARASLLLLGAPVALAILGLLLDPDDDPFTWRTVTGATVVVLALVLVTVGMLKRPLGSTRELTRPLEWLSGRQRRELSRQVRDGSAVPARLPLARLQARAMIDARVDRLPLVGLVIGYVGLWIWDHSWPRAVLTLLMVAFAAVMTVRQSRDERLARRFLEQHPGPPS